MDVCVYIYMLLLLGVHLVGVGVDILVGIIVNLCMYFNVRVFNWCYFIFMDRVLVDWVGKSVKYGRRE